VLCYIVVGRCGDEVKVSAQTVYSTWRDHMHGFHSLSSLEMLTDTPVSVDHVLA
jgi:hypothetical protein